MFQHLPFRFGTGLLSILFLLALPGFAQRVGIGTATPANAALLDLNSDDKGLRLPRVATTGSVLTPWVSGLLVFNEATNRLHFYDGTAWQQVGTAGWGLAGNAGTVPGTGVGQNYLGTSDAQPLLLATGATERMRINTAGRVGVGTTNPLAKLQTNHAVAAEDAFAAVHSGTSGSAIVALSGPTNLTPALRAFTQGTGAAGFFENLNATTGRGLEVQIASTTNNSFLSTFLTAGQGRAGIFQNQAPAPAGFMVGLEGSYAGPNATSDHIGVLGSSIPAAGWGIGVQGEGGFIGVGGTAPGIGVYGESQTFGVVGASDNVGVQGEGDVRGVVGLGNVVGTYGNGPTAGVLGQSTATGVQGEGNLYGVLGISADRGVQGEGNIFGVVGFGNTAGVAGVGPLGVFSQGNLVATGTKTFSIDHPAHPETYMLRHFSVESDEVLNFYRGNVRLDANGRAVVELPPYFALVNNTNASYYLTPIGTATTPYVAEELAEGRFVIGGEPNTKVSWMLMTERNDPYLQQNPAERAVVVDKGQDRGTYLTPQLYGQGQDKAWINRKYIPAEPTGVAPASAAQVLGKQPQLVPAATPALAPRPEQTLPSLR